MPGGAACLTIAEPNRNLNAAVAATVAPESGVAQEPQLEARSNGAYASNFTIKLLPGKPQHLVVGVHVCCKGCQAIGTPACAALPASNAGGNGAVSAAVSLAAAVAKDVAAEEASTRGWWDRYWNASSINLGPRYRQLEQFYYGLQVSAGSATFAACQQESLKKTLRAVHRRRCVASGPHGPRAVVSATRLAFFLPAYSAQTCLGRRGPWITTDGAGWNGDCKITLSLCRVRLAHRKSISVADTINYK